MAKFDLNNLKEQIQTILQEANTITASTDLSGSLDTRIQKVLKINPARIPVQASIHPYVTNFVESNQIELPVSHLNQNKTFRKANVNIQVIGTVWSTAITDNEVDPADEECEKLMENIEEVLRENRTLNGSVDWHMPVGVTYHNVGLEEGVHVRTGILTLQCSAYYTLPSGLTVPGAPTNVVAVGGNKEATITFTPPVDNGGSAITSYEVTSSPGGITASGAASPITVTGLTNGTSYTFTVTATNAIGTGPASSASNAVTPAGFVPTDIAKLLFWYRGDDVNASGSNITQINDKSGNNYHAVPGLAQPTVNAGALNGEDVISFSDSSCVLTLSGSDVYLNDSNGWDYWIIIKKDDTTQDTVHSLKYQGVNFGAQCQMSDNAYLWFAGNPFKRHYVAPSTPFGTTWHRINHRCDGVAPGTITSYSVYIDGSLGANPVSTSGGIGQHSIIGGYKGGSDPSIHLNGDIAEMIFYQTTLTDANRLQVEAYIDSRYGF